MCVCVYIFILIVPYNFVKQSLKHAIFNNFHYFYSQLIESASENTPSKETKNLNAV